MNSDFTTPLQNIIEHAHKKQHTKKNDWAIARRMFFIVGGWWRWRWCCGVKKKKKTRKNKREKTRKTHHRQHRKWREASGFCFHVCLLGLTRKQKYLFSFISYGFLSLYILLIVDGYYIVLSCIQNLRHGHRYLRLSKEGVGILKLLKTLLWPSDGGNLLLVAVVNGYDIQ